MFWYMKKWIDKGIKVFDKFLKLVPTTIVSLIRDEVGYSAQGQRNQTWCKKCEQKEVDEDFTYKQEN